MYDKNNLDEQRRKRRHCEAMEEAVRRHKHVLAPEQTGNVLRCKCGAIMGFLRDPKEVLRR